MNIIRRKQILSKKLIIRVILIMFLSSNIHKYYFFHKKIASRFPLSKPIKNPHNYRHYYFSLINTLIFTLFFYSRKWKKMSHFRVVECSLRSLVGWSGERVGNYCDVTLWLPHWLGFYFVCLSVWVQWLWVEKM